MIIAKSAWKKNNILDKINRGAKHIEIQLLDPKTDDFFNDEKREKAVPRELFKYVTNIHPPLKNKEEKSCDGPIDCKCNWNTIHRICYIANRYEELKNATIILHEDMTIKQLIDYDKYDDIIKFVKDLAKQYPQMTFAIENTTRFSQSDPFYFIKLAKAIDMPNVVVCLDICHAQMIMNERKCLNLLDTEEYKNNLKTWLKQGKIKVVHLSQAKPNIEGFGNEKGHGVTFNKDIPEDIELLKEILPRLDEDCKIVLEVQEDDYLNSVNFTKTKEAVELVLNK